MRRVLVTGATGFIGRHAIAPLRDAGFDVVAVARNPKAIAGVTVRTLDLLDPAATTSLLAELRPTHLLHLAWDVTHGAFWTSRANLDWTAASLHLYRSAIAAGTGHITVAGTCAEYDWSSPSLDEDAPLRPATLYGVAKNALHQTLRAAAALDGVSLAWGRVFLLYGPHEAPARLVSGLARNLVAGQAASVGNGDARRDFMHVADVAAALAALTMQAHDGAVNIASGHNVPISHVADLLGDIAARPDLIRIGSRAPTGADPAELVASGQRLRDLGVQPRFPLRDGLADTLAWWAAQPQ